MFLKKVNVYLQLYQVLLSLNLFKTQAGGVLIPLPAIHIGDGRKVITVLPPGRTIQTKHGNLQSKQNDIVGQSTNLKYNKLTRDELLIKVN